MLQVYAYVTWLRTAGNVCCLEMKVVCAGSCRISRGDEVTACGIPDCNLSASSASDFRQYSKSRDFIDIIHCYILMMFFDLPFSTAYLYAQMCVKCTQGSRAWKSALCSTSTRVGCCFTSTGLSKSLLHPCGARYHCHQHLQVHDL